VDWATIRARLLQIGELGLAFVLSALIGLEREIRHKSAGLRTYTLVGFAAALIMLVSKYGFDNILAATGSYSIRRVSPRKSLRVSASLVWLDFVRRDSVRGLTRPQRVAHGGRRHACGAGLPVLALVVTAGHFIVVFVFPFIVVRLPKSRWTPSGLRVSYDDGRDILRDILIACTRHDFAVSRCRSNTVQRISQGYAGDDSMAEVVSKDASARKVVTVALRCKHPIDCKASGKNNRHTGRYLRQCHGRERSLRLDQSGC